MQFPNIRHLSAVINMIFHHISFDQDKKPIKKLVRFVTKFGDTYKAKCILKTRGSRKIETDNTSKNTI